MSNEEIISFLKQIEKDYSNFSVIDENEYEVWKDTLSKITLETANAKYIEHKNNSEFNKYAPDVKYFIYKPKEELSNKKYLMKCEVCGIVYYNEAMKIHKDRHRSIKYIKSRTEKYFHSEISKDKEEELLRMPQKEFDEKYNLFLEKLISATEGWERKNLIKIKWLKNNPGKTLPIELENLYKNEK